MPPYVYISKFAHRDYCNTKNEQKISTNVAEYILWICGTALKKYGLILWQNATPSFTKNDPLHDHRHQTSIRICPCFFDSSPSGQNSGEIIRRGKWSYRVISEWRFLLKAVEMMQSLLSIGFCSNTRPALSNVTTDFERDGLLTAVTLLAYRELINPIIIYL